MIKFCGFFDYVSVTWRCDDFSEWNSWTEKMLAVGLEYWNFTFACFMIPENSNKLHFKGIPEITYRSLYTRNRFHGMTDIC